MVLCPPSVTSYGMVFLWLVSEGEGWLLILFILVELLTITV
jgi:hypothetical protein